MSRHLIEATHDTGVSVTIVFEYKRGFPAVMYLRNGDPGYPAEPAEVEFISVNDPGFESFAMAWLEEHYEDAIELAQDEAEDDRLQSRRR